MKKLLSLFLCGFFSYSAFAQTPSLQQVTELGGATTNQTISLSSDLFFTNGFMGIHFRQSGKTRWYLRHDTNETGGNAGSNFSLYSYADDGSPINQNLLIDRASGLWTINGNVRTQDITGKIFTFQEGVDYIGTLGRGGTITGGWSSIPNVYALTYHRRDFAIGGWSKTTGDWAGASLYINSDNGNVLIGKVAQANTTYKLDVAGKIRADKLVVNTTGADFVFDPTYNLLPLPELGKYITQHRHLPGIQPAREMQQEGLDVGQNQTKLLQKIEELTLYIIELNKKVTEQEKKINALEKGK